MAGNLPIRGFDAGGVPVRGFFTGGAGNTAPVSAIPLTLDATVTVDLHDGIGTGLWYSFTPTLASNPIFVGAKVLNANALLSAYLGLSLAPISIFDNPMEIDNSAQMSVPVTIGSVYYFKFISTGSPAVGTCATFTLIAPPNGSTPSGSIVITDIGYGFPATAYNQSGTLLRVFPYAAGLRGDVLPDGTTCCEQKDSSDHVASVGVFGPLLTPVATIANIAGTVNQGVASDQVAAFYTAPVQNAVNPKVVRSISSAGVVGGTTWSLATASLECIAVAPGGGILYWSAAGDGVVIHRHDLNTDSPLSNLAAGVANFKINRLLTLQDGSIVVAYRNVSFADRSTDFLRQYSAAGATLRDYPDGTLIPGYALGEFNTLARDPNGAGSFWVLFQNNPDSNITIVARLSTSTGAILDRTAQMVDFGHGFSLTTTAESFGPSFFGFFFVTLQDVSAPVIACPSPTTGIRLAHYSGVFAVTGGTPPYVFLLIDGAFPSGLSLNTSTGALTGTATRAGTYAFTVQVTDAHGLVDAVSCEITILELYGVVEKYIRRERIAPHLSNEQKQMFYPALQVEFRPGVGHAVPPAVQPQVMLSMSFDGGFQWTPEITMSAGSIGQYTKRVIARQLGYGRDTVFKVVVSDPVIWDLVNAYFDPPPKPGRH